MSQTILPPSPQPEPQPPTQPPTQVPTYYYPANDTSAVVVSEPPSQTTFEPDPPKKQPLIWRIIKWPIRQIFKLIYVTVRGMRNHKVISAILLILILGLVGAGVVGYRYLNPPSPTTANTPGATSNAPETPFTIV